MLLLNKLLLGSWKAGRRSLPWSRIKSLSGKLNMVNLLLAFLNLSYNVVLHASFAINSEEAFNHLINLNESEYGKPNYT